MDFLNIPIEIKSIDDKGRFTGYGAIFGNVDFVGDVIQPGAFDETIAEYKAANTMPSMLWEHKSHLVIGDYLEWSVDAKGLLTEGQIYVGHGIPDAERAYLALKGRARKGMSIGYRTKKSSRGMLEGKSIRKLEVLSVAEVSLTTMPINDQATIFSVKSLKEDLSIRDAEEFLRDAGNLSASEAKGFISLLKKSILREREADAATIQAATLLRKAIAEFKLN